MAITLHPRLPSPMLRQRPFITVRVPTTARVGLARAITTDLATTAVVTMAAVGDGNVLLRRSATFEGILEHGSDAFARDGARIVVRILDGDVCRFVQIAGLEPQSR